MTWSGGKSIAIPCADKRDSLCRQIEPHCILVDRGFAHSRQKSSEREMADLIWDVVVIGAGAAGLLAATRAAERGKRTLLLEKNRKPGVKILMSGGTRCNITHATDNRGIVAAFGANGKFLHSPLAALSVEK